MKYLLMNNRSGECIYSDSIKMAMNELDSWMRRDFRYCGKYSLTLVRTADDNVICEKVHPRYNFDRWYEFLNKAE